RHATKTDAVHGDVAFGPHDGELAGHVHHGRLADAVDDMRVPHTGRVDVVLDGDGTVDGPDVDDPAEAGAGHASPGRDARLVYGADVDLELSLPFGPVVVDVVLATEARHGGVDEDGEVVDSGEEIL